MKSNIKLIYIFVIVLFTNVLVKAQVSEGENFVQGSLSANKSFNDLGVNTGNYSGSIDWGKYVSKNSAKIFSLSISYQRTNTDSDLINIRNLTIGLSRGHEYYKPIFGKFGLYGRIIGGVNYSNGINDINNENSGALIKRNESTTQSIGVSLAGSGGLMYRLNNHWAFTGQLFNLNLANVGYTWKDEQRVPIQGNPTTSTSNQLNYNFNPKLSFSFGIGIRYVFK